MRRKLPYSYLTQDISIHLHCQICLEVFYKPLRSSCGHIFCTECLIRWTAVNNSCPQCRKKVKHSDTQKDYLAAALIDDFNVECLNCKWQGKFSDFKPHQRKNCEFSKQVNTQKFQQKLKCSQVQQIEDSDDDVDDDDENDVIELTNHSKTTNERLFRIQIEQLMKMQVQQSLQNPFKMENQQQYLQGQQFEL